MFTAACKIQLRGDSRGPAVVNATALVLGPLTALALVLVPVPACLAAQPAGIPAAVDGMFADWEGVAQEWMDPEGDGTAVDFGRVWVRSDAERLTIRFEVGSEINLQSGNAITLFVDGDGDATTGRAVQGIGAELVWTFGQRKGEIMRGEREVPIDQADIGLLQAPTVSSTEFEASVLRHAADGTILIPGPRVSIVLLDQSGPAGDRLPDSGALTIELFDAPPLPVLVSLDRADPNDIRVLTWNVLFDGLFKRPAPFIRVLRAIDPDVICFQEIWTHTARQAADQVSLALPEGTWYGGNTTEGHVISRYPFIEEAAIDEAGNYWTLIDLPDDRYDVDLSIVCAHPPCCDNEEGRQDELDGIAAWLRELVTPGGFDLPAGTPIIVAGDMNLVGGARQVQTLLAGQIADQQTFGPSHPPDWDGTPLADANPRHAGGHDTFTWRDPRSSFAPGKLDYIVYSDSVLELRNAFVLATEKLTPEVLERYGLRARDTLDASDHLPVVADFTPAVGQSRTGAAE